jgi:protoheme IX farnesyltransferase
MTPQDARTFGVVLSLMSTWAMLILVGIVPAALLAASILFYVFAYTMILKRSTPQNIVIGGAAGAIPPMIGWACVSGDISWASFSLFLIIFMWTPPHFWALSLYRSEDYAKAGVPMLPVTHGIRSTQWHILIYTLLLVPTTLLPYGLGLLGPVYLTCSLLLGAGMIWLSLKAMAKDYEKSAKQLFAFSIFYLFLLFLGMLGDRFL